MAGEAEKIYVLGCHVDGQDSRRLGRVHDQLQAMSMGNGPHPADIHRVAREVGGMGADDGSGLWPDQPLKIAVVDPSLPVSRDKAERHAPLRLQPVQGSQHGIMLQIRGDHMVAGVQQSADGDIQRLGGIAGEYHMIRPGAVEKRRQLLPCAIDDPGGGKTAVMGAAGAVSQRGHGGHHRVDHRLGLSEGRGGVIQIDHGRITFPAAASVSTMAYILVTLPTASVSFSL